MASHYKNCVRPVLLMDYLRQFTNEETPVTRDRLCEYLECERKTVQREIAALQKCGFQIGKKLVGRQYAYYYDGADLTLAELQILADEIQSESFLSPSNTEDFVEKLEEIGGERRAVLLQQTIVPFNALKHTNAPVLSTVGILQQAILRQRQVSFLYFDWDENHDKAYRKNDTGEEKRYIVHPIGLVNKNDNYYLLTYNPQADAIYPYRLDRVDAAILLEDPVDDRAVALKEAVPEFTRQAFRMYGGETETVTLQFCRKAINYVFDKFGGDVVIKKLADDVFETEVEVQISPPFFGWLFQFTDLMQITAPESVVDQYESRKNLRWQGAPEFHENTEEIL